MGKIEFIGMVKGKNSSVYRNLLGRFAQLAPDLVKSDYLDVTPQIQVAIYTEGKTDGKHLNAALTFFQSQRNYRQVSIVCFDNQGFDNLEKRLDFAVGHTDKNTKPHIFIFDRDVDKALRKKVGGDEQYKGWGNGIYSLLLPLPKHREETPDISIEFYYKDEDLFRKDEHGRRLFLSTEFNKSTGRHWNDDLNCITLKKLGNPLKVIDDKVFNSKNENVAMSKDQFAENVLRKFGDIDFAGFTTLFEVISMIVADFNVEA
jgi:RNA-directed DNA polymerase